MTADPKYLVPEFGEHCTNPGCNRYALPADRATCTHKAICEDCWPNGCDECELEVLPNPWWSR